MQSLAELQRRIEAGELSPDEAVARSRTAIELQDASIGAFVNRAENVRAASSGPLRGIAVGIMRVGIGAFCQQRAKDVGIASLRHADQQRPFLVGRLIKAGAYS